jgi:hypothetical protein
VIDELLSYIQNKISIVDEETLVRICTTSFSSDEIKNSKSLLFDSIAGKTKIKRKNKGKEERDISDIINVFKSTEPDLVPVFVARQLEKLPPVLFDHLDCTKLLKDLVKVQNELQVIKQTYVTQDQLVDQKRELLQNMKSQHSPTIPGYNAILRRSAWLYDSGPIGLSHVSNNLPLNESLDNMENNVIGRNNTAEQENILRVPVNKQSECESSERSLQRSPAPGGGDVGGRGDEERRKPSVTDDRRGGVTSQRPTRERSVDAKSPVKSNASSVRGVKIVNNVDGWHTVSKRKRPQYRYHGKFGISKDMEGNFKAAETRIPMFITKVHKDTSEKDIEKYVYRKTNEVITLEKITFKQDRDYKAYKFFVPENKLMMFLDSGLWPQGIVFRRFVHFKQKYANRDVAVTAVQKNV